jgi:hypothetical protein
MRWLVLTGAVCVLASACSTRNRERLTAEPPPAPTSFAWARSDGQRIAGNPELTENAQSDIAACQAETPPQAARGVPGEACMRTRGYYIRPI